MIFFPSTDDRTVARMMMPPNQGRKSSTVYRQTFDARVMPAINKKNVGNEDDHFYTARANYVLEFASMVGAEVLAMDNKDKIKVGRTTLAVDRRTRNKRLFPQDDRPNYYDHDFPTPKYLLTPCGYLRLTTAEDPAVTTDEHGRKHYAHPEVGPSFLVNRGPHDEVTIETHIGDVLQMVHSMVAARKTILVLIVDGGCDYNINHPAKEIFYGRLFRDTNLDGLVVTSYCPGHSSLNPIERLWGQVTKALSSVYLFDTLPGIKYLFVLL
ncbi:uncharacterized protein LOC110990782 [Acanthaster planci]|uniref:Uncharacterized protein LOC110990782 n=1 Tax=Acanthaster planci TaxID=133434 RepID=A0A8B8A2I0_ACAPL|nr:uncharacterized protein LOC110990782 [Acanthaster planci]